MSGDSVRVRIDAKRVAYGWEFSSDMDIYELAEEIERRNTQLTANVYQGNIIKIATATNIFYVRQSVEYGEYIGLSFRYIIGSTDGLFVYSPIETNDIEDSSVTRVPMYMPYHLIRGLPGIGYSFFSIQHVWEEPLDFALRHTIECEALGGIDDFVAFYDRIIHCDIEIIGDTLVVTNKTNGYIMDITFSQNAEFQKVTFSVLRNFVLE